ncbi:Phosphatidylinositol-glycan biosynthesis class X protein [Bienertia sinuspersici]
MAVEFGKAIGHFLIVILLHFTISVSSPTSNQEKLYNYNGNYHEHNINSLPCYARYALESFFRDYDSFTYSNFVEYMDHNAIIGSVYSRLVDLERHLIGEGSHRRLASSIKFSMQPDLIADFSSHICEVIVIERLPSGVFADSFELQHLVHRGVFKDAFVFGDTNLELPSFLSNQSIVEIHLDAALNNSAGKEIPLELTMEIPLHARYPPLEESGYSKIRFGAPDLFMRCKLHPAQGCSLSPITTGHVLEFGDIIWSMPAGVKAHSRIVSVATFVSALLSATLIIIASLCSSRIEYNGRLKQS